MKVERHREPWPWEMLNPTPTNTAFVIGEGGQNILALTRSSTVLVPHFQLVLPEHEYIDALVDACNNTKGKPPETLHIFEHEGMVGFYLQ